MTTKNQLTSLYIHIPFCRQKCRYCDFLSWPDRMDLTETYTDALLREIELYQGLLASRRVNTVYLGGGTPSLLSGPQVKRILQSISSAGTILPDAEISMEANPEQLTSKKLSNYFDAGVNRLSIGLQATDPYLLGFLGRHHTAADFFNAVDAAREAGFSNINADLIFGIPGQNMTLWKQTLQTVADKELPHISCYGLTYEEGTPLYAGLQKNEFNPVSEELEWQMYRYAIQFLQRNGYLHYEISNYAKQNHECRHNLTYWENREYIGLGAGAHGFVDGQRTENTKNLQEYLQHIEQDILPVKTRHMVTLRESVSETMFLGLRLRKGISETAFRKRYGRSIREFYPDEIDKLVERGLLHDEDHIIRLTETGFDLANQVFSALLLD